ncbi:MAG: SH3 domain-containing protein [bacterium]|nr:SH3 domain-containing protein [bacterium]
MIQSTKGNSRRGYSILAAGAAIVFIVASFALFGADVYAYTSANGTVACASGRVRESASTNGYVVCCVKKDEALIITDEITGTDGNKWYKVKVSGAEGYIRSDLVKKGEAIAGAAASTTAASTTSTTGGAATTTVKGTNVIVRTEASRSSDVSCTLSTGQAVTVISSVKGSDGNTWYSVKAEKNGIFYDGYIRADLLNGVTAGTTTATTTTAAAGTASTGTPTAGVIKGSNVRIRNSATTQGGIVTVLNSGVVVTIKDSTKDDTGKKWYEIACVVNGAGVSGYIREDLLTITATASAGNTTNTASATLSGTTGVIKGTGVRVRTTASLTSNVCCGLSTGQQVTLLESASADQKTWYKIAFTYNNEAMTGYVCSDYVEKSSSQNVTAAGTTAAATTTVTKVGTVKGTKVNIRKEAVSGEIVTELNTGQITTVTSETTGSDGNKWYGISFTLNGASLSGFIRSDFLTVEEKTVVVPAAATTTTSASSSSSHRTGAVKGINVNVRKEPVNGSIVCKLSTGHTVTVTDEKTASDGNKWYGIAFTYENNAQSGYIRSDYLTVEEAVVTAATTNTNSSTSDGTTKGTVKGTAVRVRESAVNGTVVAQLNTDHSVAVTGETNGSDGYKWYQISFEYAGATKSGFIRSDFVNIIQTASSTVVTTTEEFEKTIADFPESYKNSLRTLHNKYANWTFQPVKTNLEWNNVAAAETAVGKNLISKSSISSWKSTSPQAYDWTSDNWYGFDGASWVAASPEITLFYLDPRNFLDENGIFQFETLEYENYQNESGVSNILASSFMSSTFTDTDGANRSYASTFTEAGTATGISPYHLAARCLQEQGTAGTSQSIAGNVSGLENLFNFFNIGAYAANGNTAVINGLIYAAGSEDAYYRPWNSRYKSIMGSAKYISERYIKKGQNTLYFQKFNVVNSENGLYSHQYMTNIQAASSEAARMKKAYSDMNTALVFKIPVYNNMPEAVCAKPESSANPNCYLSNLYIDGYGTIPNFNAATDQYSFTIDNGIGQIGIGATPVNGNASIAGTGTYDIPVGTTQITVVCKAQNGNTRNYVMNITRNQ